MKWHVEFYFNNAKYLFLSAISSPFVWLAVVIACLVAMFLLGALRKHQ